MTRQQSLVAFLSGALFAVGLVLSGMTQPSKVVGFLDFTGAWDPSLAFVMGGAIAINLVLYRLSGRRVTPLFAQTFQRPAIHTITPSLLVGSGLFGIGWGLAGYCPGPGIVSSVTSGEALLFVATMTMGMALHRLWERARETTPAPEPASSSMASAS